MNPRGIIADRPGPDKPAGAARPSFRRRRSRWSGPGGRRERGGPGRVRGIALAPVADAAFAGTTCEDSGGAKPGRRIDGDGHDHTEGPARRARRGGDGGRLRNRAGHRARDGGGGRAHRRRGPERGGGERDRVPHRQRGERVSHGRDRRRCLPGAGGAGRGRLRAGVHPVQQRGDRAAREDRLRDRGGRLAGHHRRQRQQPVHRHPRLPRPAQGDARAHRQHGLAAVVRAYPQLGRLLHLQGGGEALHHRARGGARAARHPGERGRPRAHLHAPQRGRHPEEPGAARPLHAAHPDGPPRNPRRTSRGRCSSWSRTSPST